MLKADAKTEALRRASLFVGAVLLASSCARGLYFLAGCRFGTGVSAFPLLAAILIIAVGLCLAITVHDRFLKGAALLLITEYVLTLLPPLRRTRAAFGLE